MLVFIPNDEQKHCITKIETFFENQHNYSKLIINGSAGTGKTTILVSSIINFIAKQININYHNVKQVITHNLEDNMTYIKNFIIAAPTNKAKDVLISKYNTYLNNIIDDTIIERYLLNEISHKKIDFLTVAQLLSINRVINEMGEEEFTKGNDKKIADKYNKTIYDNYIIIIDECSMLDTNTIKLLNIIRCPIIYIGDYCQLPPVNEILSPIFNITEDATIEIIKLSKVERCKNDITVIANGLRDKIYDIVPDFNLIKHKITDLIFYPKKLDKWLDVYVNEIKTKLQIIDKVINDDIENIDNTILTPENNQLPNDTMALAWTNKCCSILNKKIRTKLFINNILSADNDKHNDIENIKDIDDLDNNFLVKGDKLLVKAPYYKYNHRFYSSSIIYIANLQKTIYKPLSFQEWIKLGKLLNNDITTDNASLIDINSILNDIPKQPSKINTNPKKSLTLLDYFDVNASKPICVVDTNSDMESQLIEMEKQQKELAQKELAQHRILFYKYHNLQSIISLDEYNFTDDISKKYNSICTQFNLLDIKHLPSTNQRIHNYKLWHRTICILLYGIPNDNVICKKCLFFIKKFNEHLDKSCHIIDMHDASNNLSFDMYLSDIATFTTTSNFITPGIPILDINVKNNLDVINHIKEIVRSSYEVKMILTKQDEKDLRAINKMLNEDETNTTTQKYITMSQMLGHYMNHVITSAYLDVDYGYALTVHKSQGSTYDNVFIEYSNLLANRKDTEKYKLLYTAITRCANKLHIFY